MYHKVRNTLTGLAIVFAIFSGGVLLSEPVPAKPVAQPMSAEAQQAAATLALIQAAVNIAQAGLAAQAAEEAEAKATEAARHAPPRSPSRLRLELGMPFYSFGAVLPRRRES